MTPRILICATQVPFARGGAEILVDSLEAELARRGFAVEVVRLPFAWGTREDVLKSALAWRLLDLERVEGRPIDLVLGTRFPSYAVRHPNKVVWLIHQFRQVYDLLGTPFSDFEPRGARDARVIEMVRAVDRRTLGEARALFTIAGNTSARLERWNGLASTPLYPPPKLTGRYRAESYGDFILGVGRLDPLKRFDLLVRAVAAAPAPARCILAGTGPERERLAALAAELGAADRVELVGWVDDERLLDLYARCRGVFYAPYDEDYGYVTVEAFEAAKPVLTATDSGAVLEHVRDGENGFICPPGKPRELAERIGRLLADPALAQRLGEQGRASVAGIGWDRVVERLTETL